MNALKFDIANLLVSCTGTRELFSFGSPVKFEGINAESGIKGRLEIMKIDEGVNVRIEHAEINVKFICGRCLKAFVKTIVIPAAERQFLLDAPKKPKDPNDTFFIDKKKQKIEISEMIRQEIILHFPIISVCSRSCKGICEHCGKNRNNNVCDCKEESIEGNKPLSILKKLIKK